MIMERLVTGRDQLIPRLFAYDGECIDFTVFAGADRTGPV
jgi:hypothetical protein